MLRKTIYLIFSLVVSVGIIAYLLSHVSVTDVIELVKGIDRSAVVIFVFLSFAMSFFRTWRYSLLLGISGYQPNSISLFLVVLVRNFFSDLLPARLGTLIYVYIVTSRLGIPFGPAASSFALSFLFDIIALAPIVLFAAWTATLAASIPSTPFILGSVLLLLITIALLLLLPKCCHIASVILDKMTFLSQGIREKLSGALDSSERELLRVKDAGVYKQVFILSFFVRILKYSSFYFLLYALLKPIGYHLEDLEPAKIFLGLCSSELAASLPISGIAGFGVYEGTWAMIFELLGFPGKIAKLTAISHHLFTQVYGYSLGLGALLVLLLPIFKINVEDDIESENNNLRVMTPMKLPLFLPKLLLLSAVIVAATLTVLITDPLGKKAESHASSATSDVPTPAEKRALIEISEVFPGKILFDSRRSETFGIYTIDADGNNLTKIIDTPEWHETYPDPSPDGKQIVYARKKSLARRAPAEVWIINRDGSNPKMLNGDGTFPTFSTDGQTVYFERDRKKAMAMDLDGTNERELFPAGHPQFNNAYVVKPRVSRDGKMLSFTSDKPNRWNAWFVNLESKEATRMKHGCEPAFSHNSDFLVMIKKQGMAGRSGVLKFERESNKASIYYDGKPPLGHDYFPTLAAEDRFLLYSACRQGEHSHEDSNYQIFIKDREREQAVRLNFDAHTNRWPKLLPPVVP
ncbi:hypothetical protein BVY02_01655 [bacterium J17]|nr:hypothetical protein BVY02_01655 [bacterium J17]